MAKFHTIAFALLATTLTAQSTWTVDPSGNGDFLSLSAAQTGATAGDTLIVVGSVPGITLTKRLNIVAHGATITSGLGIYATGGLSVSGGDFAGITVANSTASLDDVTSARLRVTGNGTVSARVENYAISAAAGVSVVNTNLPWMTGTSDYPGGTLAINVDSTAATLATISANIGIRPPIATPIGRVWLAPAYVPVTAGFTDANGELATTIAVPTMVTRGLTVTFQGVVFPAAGGITATAPAILHVL